MEVRHGLRKRGNYPQDIHILTSHRNAPNRLYGVLGDSFLKEPGQEYAESNDGGKTWNYMCSGLKHHYAYQMAVNPNDPRKYYYRDIFKSTRSA